MLPNPAKTLGGRLHTAVYSDNPVSFLGVMIKSLCNQMPYKITEYTTHSFIRKTM